MAWLMLVAAGILEVIWAFFMKQSAGFTRWLPALLTVVTMAGSVVLLAMAMRTLPLGTAYTIWTGIGALGAFFVGIVVLGCADRCRTGLDEGLDARVKNTGFPAFLRGQANQLVP